MTLGIADNLRRVHDRVAAAAVRSGRTPSDITLIAVTKTWSSDVVQQVVDAGAVDLGENRVQEAQEKVDRVSGRVAWHLIGSLQRNKVKTALSIFSLIHSVDSLRLAVEIGKQAALLGRDIPILIQVNTSGEVSKSGVSPDAALGLVGEISGLRGLRIEGLMTIGPYVSDPEQVRPFFAALRNLRERILDAHLEGVSMAALSMGMTNDFEVAIEEGATMVRVGTAIFGSRRAR
jgi:PLP dependent protein